MTVIVLLPFPKEDDTAAHGASLLTVQPVLDVISKVFCSPAAVKLSEVGETVRSESKCCTTEKDSEDTPVPLTVMVAILGLSLFALDAAVTVTVPLLFPEVGATEAQESELLTDQLVLDVMSNVFCPPEAVKLSPFVEIDSDCAGDPSSMVPNCPQTGCSR